MKILPSIAVFSLLSLSVLADIHDPISNDYGPTRKLGRGVANIAFGITEIPNCMDEINNREGNAAAWSYGFVRGTGRFFARLGFGIYELATFPIPTYRSSYRPPYKSKVPWINGGFDEFPPELGFESRYIYSRSYNTYF